MNRLQELQRKAEEFRAMHLGPDIIVLPNAWDHASAAMIAAAGFPVIGTTSAGIAYAQGYPDGERLGRRRMLELVGRIVAQSPVPVSGDMEAGYGPTPEDVAATVTGAIEIGLVGCNIEDADPSTGQVLDFDLAVARIRAGRAAADRLKVPFVLNARTDVFLKPIGDAKACYAEAVRRANAFLEAGATCAFVPGPVSGGAVAKLVKSIDGPLNILGGQAGSGGANLAELHELGVRRVSIGGSLMLAMSTYVRKVAQDIQAKGDFSYAAGAITNAEMNAWMERLPAI